MKLLKILFFAFHLLITTAAIAHSIDCGHFYPNVNNFERDLKELKKSFYPLSDGKQKYLENLEYSVRSNSNESGKIFLYTDPDYEQFKITKQIDKLIDKAEFFKQRNTWMNDKLLLVNVANQNLSLYKNQWGNDAFENIGAYILASNDIAIFINDFKINSFHWKQNKRVLPSEMIQWVEMKTIPFLSTYTQIANCHTQFLSFEISDFLKRNEKK